MAGPWEKYARQPAPAQAPAAAPKVGPWAKYQQAQGGERTLGQRLYDNIVGDPNDGVQSTGEALGTWLNRAGESMTLGVVGDEASAAVTGQLPGRSYENELARYRANEEGMSTLGRVSADLSGAIVPGLAGLGVVSGAATPLGAMGRGALMGAGAGAVQGAMEGEGGAVNRFLSGVVGGGLGGAAGALIPAVAAGAKGAYRAGAEALANRRAGAEAAKGLGVSPRSARTLGEVLGLDDAASMRAAIGRAGDNAMLADSGPAAAGALDAAMQSPGRAARTAQSRIDTRAAEAVRGLNTTMDRVMGAADGVGGLKAGIRDASAPARQAAYDLAYSRPIDYSAPAGRQIEDLMRRVPGDAIRRANQLMALEGNQSRQILAQIADDGTVSLQRMPDVRQLDYITRALNDVAAAADGQGKLGGTTALGRATAGLSKSLRSAVTDAVPEYRVALDTAADAISEVKGVDLGAKLFQPSTTREAVKDALQGASAAERAAIKRGARSAIDERLANVRAVISDHEIEPRQAMEAFRSMTSPAAKEKMRMLLGADWPALEAEINKAGVALSLRARTAANSRTFGRTATNELLDDLVAPSALRRGKPLEGIKDVAATAMGASKTAVNRMRTDAKAEIAELLTRPGQAETIMSVLESARARNAVSPDAGKRIAEALNVLGLGYAPQASARAIAELLRQ